MFPLFESIRIEQGKFVNLQGHRRRMERSYYRYYGMRKSFFLEKMLQIPSICATHPKQVFKLRLMYNLHSFRQEYEPYHPREIRSFKFVTADLLDYSLKYTDREEIEELKRNSGADEIIIVRKGLITDTSFSNLVFFDGVNWFTPRQPLLYGTAREKLLAAGIISECDIRPSDLEKYNRFSLINAMLPLGQMEFSVSMIVGG